MPKKGVVLSPEAAAKQAEAIKRWHKENTEALTIRVPKGERERYKRLAEARGKSVAAIVKDYLAGECEKEGL